MSRTINYSLPASQGGGKLTSFTYSRSLGELIGTWSAEVAGGTFTAGNAFSVPCMKNGLIERAWKDPDGLWHLSGKDAGVRLMRTTPPAKSLKSGNAKAVIGDLADFCGLACHMNENGLSGFSVRSAVTGTTCAEAILELAMLSGCIAYIDNNGGLVVAPPATAAPSFSVTLDDAGSELDLDGYATFVAVVVTRRKKTLKEEEEESGGETGGESGSRYHYRGVTPPGTVSSETHSGQFSFTDTTGKLVNGSYLVTILEPLKALSRSETTITRDNVTVKTVEEHFYRIQSKNAWRGRQEYRLFAWAESGYKIEKTVSGTYWRGENLEQVFFGETTTETMGRNFSITSVPWASEDWEGKLDMVTKEEIVRTTVRTGSQEPDANMPPYAPPFDMTLTREYKRMDFGRGLFCTETETRYEARQLGQIAGLKKWNPVTEQYEPYTPSFSSGTRYQGLATHTSPDWVAVESTRVTYEKYKDNGDCVVSTRSEWCDDGAKWFMAHGIVKTGDEDVDKYQEDYAKFSQKTNGLEVSVNGGSYAGAWQFLELPGRVLVIADEDSEDYSINSEDWYFNGSYVPSKVCPHFEEESLRCGVYGISAIGDFRGETCPYHGRSGGNSLSWRGCVRAKAALEQAKAEQDRPLLEPPVVGTAGTLVSERDVPAAGYRREFYVDDIISESSAQGIANDAAANILSVKGTKGLRKTVTIPYDGSIVPNGSVVSVNHDWINMQTTVSYRVSGVIPDFAIPASMSGIADGVDGRNSARQTRPMSGTVTAIRSSGTVVVNINGMEYDCSTRLISIGVGDSVLVSFSSGNSLHGHIIERL